MDYTQTHPLKAVKSIVSLFVVVAMLAMLSGCGGDDPKPVSKIVGKWDVQNASGEFIVPGFTSLTAYYISLGVDAEFAEDFVEYLDDLYSVDDIFVTLEFKADGTYVSNNGSSNNNGKWELSSDEKTLTADKGTPSEFIFQVGTLTDTELVLQIIQDDLEGAPEGAKYVGSINMKRL